MDGFSNFGGSGGGSGAGVAHVREGVALFTNQSSENVVFAPITTMASGSPQVSLVDPNPPVTIWVENVTLSGFEIHASANFTGQVRWIVDGIA